MSDGYFCDDGYPYYGARCGLRTVRRGREAQ